MLIDKFTPNCSRKLSIAAASMVAVLALLAALTLSAAAAAQAHLRDRFPNEGGPSPPRLPSSPGSDGDPVNRSTSRAFPSGKDLLTAAAGSIVYRLGDPDVVGYPGYSWRTYR